MSRYIDYDALIDRLGICVKTGMGSTIAFTFKHIADETPSIDIVRCGECRWYNEREGCFFSTAEITADDFCSYGQKERASDGQVSQTRHKDA